MKHVSDSSYKFLKSGLFVLLSTLLVTSCGFLHIKEHLGLHEKQMQPRLPVSTSCVSSLESFGEMNNRTIITQRTLAVGVFCHLATTCIITHEVQIVACCAVHFT